MILHSLINEEKSQRPEDIIIGTDPVSIDILRQIYSAISDISDERRSFLETCWKLGIEKAYNNRSVKLDPDLCFKLLEQTYLHLEKTDDVWEGKEEDLYEIFEKVISLKASRDTGLKELFDALEKSVTSILQLDFAHKVPLNNSFKDKRNIFNYVVLLFNTVIEKMEYATVSKKAINTYFLKHPQTILIVADRSGRIRFVNQLGEQLLRFEGIGVSELEGKKIIRDYSKLIKKFNEKGKVESFVTELLPLTKNVKSIPVSISIPESIKDRSEIEEIVFIIQKNENKSVASSVEMKKVINETVNIANLVNAVIEKIRQKNNSEDIAV
jgi:RNAse (barnase) inhibitor barstar